MEDVLNKIPNNYELILFDGVCNFCNSSINFIIDHDPHGVIRFAALQSEAGRALLRECGLPQEPPGSLVLVERGRACSESAAVLGIAAHLRRPWSGLRFLRTVPAFVRDAVYRFVARHRYRWFGRTERCRVPTTEERARFLV